MEKAISVRFDKFHNKKETQTQNVILWAKSPLYDLGLSWSRNDIKGSFRYLEYPTKNSILLDLDYFGSDWLFLEQGDLVFNLDDARNIQLKPAETDSSVGSNEHAVTCHERLYYELSIDELKDICAAQKIEFQITGKTTFVRGKNKRIQQIARNLYATISNDCTYPIKKVRSSRSLIVLLLFIIILGPLAIPVLLIWALVEYGMSKKTW